MREVGLLPMEFGVEAVGVAGPELVHEAPRKPPRRRSTGSRPPPPAGSRPGRRPRRLEASLPSLPSERRNEERGAAAGRSALPARRPNAQPP